MSWFSSFFSHQVIRIINLRKKWNTDCINPLRIFVSTYNTKVTSFITFRLTCWFSLKVIIHGADVLEVLSFNKTFVMEWYLASLFSITDPTHHHTSVYVSGSLKSVYYRVFLKLLL